MLLLNAKIWNQNFKKKDVVKYFSKKSPLWISSFLMRADIIGEITENHTTQLVYCLQDLRLTPEENAPQPHFV